MCCVEIYGGKVDGPNLVTYINWTLVCEWCVIGCGFRNEHQNDTCSKDIGLSAQNW
jgi:hypothetical protein